MFCQANTGHHCHHLPLCVCVLDGVVAAVFVGVVCLHITHCCCCVHGVEAMVGGVVCVG